MQTLPPPWAPHKRFVSTEHAFDKVETHYWRDVEEHYGKAEFVALRKGNQGVWAASQFRLPQQVEILGRIDDHVFLRFDIVGASPWAYGN